MHRLLFSSSSELGLSRRSFLKNGLAAASVLALTPVLSRSALAAFASEPARQIALANLHTGEHCAVTYWEDGEYVTDALVEINRIMRDHRNNEEHPIDTALLDLLNVLHGKLETDKPFEVVSGYRSPASNAAMHARSSGVAKHSLHIEGKAIDIRMSGRSLAGIHRSALALGMGGVGYYPSSNFVHVDTGRVRQWAGA